MIEVQCPRCTQYWYSDDEDEGHVRLCSRCSDELKRKRGHRAEIDIPFLIGVGMFLVFDLMMIALTALMPEVFGKVTLSFGLLLLLAGWAIFVVLDGSWRGIWWVIALRGDIDWNIGRWGLLMVLSGFALIAAYGSFARLAR